MFQEFIDKIASLSLYYLLHQEQNVAILGKDILVQEKIEYNARDSFMVYDKIIKDKEVPVFFLVTLNREDNKVIDQFEDNKLPILFFKKSELSLDIKDINKILEEFIHKTFYPYQLS